MLYPAVGFRIRSNRLPIALKIIISSCRIIFNPNSLAAADNPAAAAAVEAGTAAAAAVDNPVVVEEAVAVGISVPDLLHKADLQ